MAGRYLKTRPRECFGVRTYDECVLKAVTSAEVEREQQVVVRDAFNVVLKAVTSPEVEQ